MFLSLVDAAGTVGAGQGRGLKALFATDLSASSIVARQLLPRLTWPSGSDIELLHVIGARRDGLSSLWGASEPARVAALREVSWFASELEGDLFEQEVFVTSAIRVGDPATRIVERARSLAADLVVVGSRGRGALATTLLGSVSAGVVDRASCSVLVARTEQVNSILLADNGSPAADAAGETLKRWPLFDRARITVGSVLEMRVPAAIGMYGYAPSMDFDYRAALPDSARERASEVVGQRMRELRAPGRSVFGRIREGDPADELLRLARTDGCDLIAVGATDKGAFAELLLGGVVRNLVRRFEGSVLVARQSAVVGQIKPALGSQ